MKRRSPGARRTEANPFLAEYEAMKASWPPEASRLFDSGLLASRRREVWDRVINDCDELRKKYAWAIPDDRAIMILAHLAPVVEICAGTGYWASLVAAQGGQIEAFDRSPPEHTYYPVTPGGPEDIRSQATLFLCYPDDAAPCDADDADDAPSPRSAPPQDEQPDEEDDGDSESSPCASVASLAAFAGDTVVLCGESFVSGTLSQDAAPWGRSFDSAFQVHLATNFHCVLVADLPRWPISRDVVSVWLRTKVTPPVSEPTRDAADDDQGAWADIPPGEVLTIELAAPVYAFLLTAASDPREDDDADDERPAQRLATTAGARPAP